jgi:hypothetical protein
MCLLDLRRQVSMTRRRASPSPPKNSDSLRSSLADIRESPVPLASRDPLSAAFSKIAEAAVLAPSADNRHSFRLRLFPSGLDLEAAEGHLEDPYHRRVLSLVSYGAVVENIILRAGSLGFAGDVQWSPDEMRPGLIARISLSHAAPSQSLLEAAIPERHTNRSLMFSGPRLGPAEIEAYTSLAEGTGGVSLVWFSDPSRRRLLLRLIRAAETERFQNPKLHRELFGSIRFDVGWRATANEGLPPAALGVEPGLRWMFSQLRHWPVMQALNFIGASHALGFRAAYLPCRFAPHLGVLVTDSSPEVGAARVGRALERVWLKAASEGLAFQPFAAAALLAFPEYREVSSGAREALVRGWRGLVPGTPMMVFRMGRAQPPSARTARLPVEHYLV